MRTTHMMKNLLGWMIFVVLLLAALGQGFYFANTLPDVVASHFNASGNADSWMNRKEFVAFYFATIAGTALILLLCAASFRAIKPRYLNLPNKEYWLAPERRKETLGYLSQAFAWFASATLLLLIDIFHQTYVVNTNRAETLPHPKLSLVLYAGFAFIWLVIVMRRFAVRSPRKQ